MASSNLDGARQAATRFERQSVLDWLYCTDPAVKHAASRKLHQPGSNTWALEADVFKDWTTTPGRVLWLHGIPGAGKTILCSTLIDHVQGLCKAQSGAHLAYYYFDSGDPSNQNPGRVFRCLLWQLTRQHDVVSSPVLDLYASCDKGYGTGYHKDRKEVSDDQLASTLFEVLRGDRQPFIILDGLDECAEEERGRFFDVLLKHLGRASCKVNFLVTSRKQPDIEERMGEVPNSKLHVMPIFTRDVTTDIRLYVAAQLATQRATRDWNDETLEKEVEDTISEQAHGMFRWAYCQLESINKCNQIQSVRETLKCLPTTLYATYDRILASIPDEAAGIVFAALTMLTYSARPLTLQELADAVAIDCQRGAFDADEDYLTRCREVLEMCGSLLTLPKQKNTGMSRRSSAERKIMEAWRMQLVGYQPEIGRRHRSHGTDLGIVEFAHFTVKEYMVLGRPGGNANLERFSFSATQAHRLIAERCLTYLLIFSEGKRLVNIHLASFPFLAYAAQNWAEHWRRQLGNGENQGLVSDLLRRLFDTEQEPNNFLNLLAICPPDDRVIPGGIPGGKSVVSAENGRETSLDALPQPLHYAAHLGLPELCQWLILEKGCDVNSPRGTFGQPLHVAAGLGHVNAVTVFLDHGADPNSAAGPCGYPLQAAAFGGHVETARILLERGADVNGKGGSYGTALIAACRVGYAEVTQLLLDNGADIEAESVNRGRALANAVANGNDATVQLLLRKRPQLNYGCEFPPLYWAAQKGNLDLVKTLVAAGADVNQRSSLCQTPLMGACRGSGEAKRKGAEEGMGSRHLEVARYLIQSGADVNQHDHHGGDALQTAVDATAAGNVEGNNIDLVTLLLEAGADVNHTGGPHRSAMQAAVSRGNMAAAHALLDRGVEVNDEIFLIAVKERRKSIIQRLLSTGVNANAKNEHGTALSLAILADDQETTDALLRDPTIDINAVAGNRGNITALSQAIAKNSFVLVQRLLELGANVQAPSSDGNTCLLHAVRSGDRNIIELLLASGADINAGQPLAVACERGAEELVRYLLDQGADVNARASGLAPDALQRAAAITRHPNIVKLLLDRGADVKAPEGRYGSCLESAISARRPDITRLLLDAGANVNFSRPLKDLDQHGKDLGRGGPLSAAIAHPQPGLLAELIERGADVNFRGLPSSAEFVSHVSHGGYILSGAPLMQAVKLQRVDEVEVLLKSGANVNQVGDGDGCALVSAILNRHNPFVTGMVQRLLDAGADVNLQGGDYGCPLAAAVAKRNLDLVAKLLDLGADVNAPAAEHGSPLMIAIREGDLDVFRLLLARGANVDAIYEGRGESVHTMSIELLTRRANVAANGHTIYEGQGGSALEVAGGRHAHTMFNELLARGVDVTANGSAAVVACAGAGNTTGLLALLDRGANMHIQQGVPGKALHEAARCLHIGTVKVLLERGVDVNSFGGVHGNALMAALGYLGRLGDGLRPMIDLLLDAGASPNSPPSEKYTSPLHAAIRKGKLELARKLLDKGADANAHDPRFGTPLTAASSVGDVTLMKRLIGMGADPSLAGNEHGSALQAAARGGHLPAARYLLTLPTVDINQCSGKWGVALHAACHSGRDDDVVRLLLANGADVNARGGQYGTALQAAAAGGQLEAVKLLLQHGADPLAAGGKFGSALEAALGGKQPHYHVANYLRRHLAKVEAQEAPAEGVRT